MVKKTTLYNSDNEKLYPRTSAECVGYGDGTVKDALDNTGVGDYPAFSASTAYSAGDVVNYQGKLYQFTTYHAAGAFDEGQVEETSLKGEIHKKVTELENQINTFGNGLFSDTIKGFYSKGGTLQESENWRTTGVVEVNEGDVFKITATIDKGVGADLMYLIGGWNAEDVFSSLYDGLSINDYLTIPANINRIVVSSYNDGNQSVKKTESLSDKIAKNAEDILSLSNNVKVLEDKLIYNENLFTQTKKGFYSPAGTFMSSENWLSTDKISVNENDVIRVKLSSPVSTYALIGGWDNSGSYQILVAGGVSYEQEYIIPADIIFIALTTVPKRGEYYGYLKTDINKVVQEQSEKILNINKRDIDIYVPSKIYGIENKPLRIYPYNLVAVNGQDYSVDVWLDGEKSNQIATVISSATSKDYKYLYRNYDGIIYELGTIHVQTCSPTNPQEKIFVLPIGDSLTYYINNEGNWVNEFSRMINGTGDAIENGIESLGLTNIEIIGTLGSNVVKHEGRSGWSLKNYLNDASAISVDNAFFNPEKSKFDLNYYLENNGFYDKGVSSDGSNLYIIIMLNWNSVYNHTDEQFIEWYNELIEDIHSSHVSANILIVGINAPGNINYKSYTGSRNVSVANILKDCMRIEKNLDTIAENKYYVTHIPMLPCFCGDGAYETEAIQPNLRETETVEMCTDYVHPKLSGLGQISDIILRGFLNVLQSNL